MLSIYFARKEAIDSEKGLALSYAMDVLARTEAVTDQIDSGIKKLAAARSKDPCSASNQTLMRQIDLSSSYIQAVGFIADHRVVCSSLGADLDGFDLGAVDMVRPSGVKLWINVEFPFTPGTKFLVIERDGYIAVIHKDLPIDVTTSVKGVSLATVVNPESTVLTSRGVIKPEWMVLLKNKGEETILDKDFVVAVIQSKRYLVSAICAIQASELKKRINAISMVLVPAGLMASIIFAGAIYYLAKRKMAMPALIRAALKRNEFYLEYQPVVDLQTGQLAGAEALVRWRMGNEIIKPEIFIPIAEECDLIQQISRCVTGLVAADASELFRRYPDFHIAINLSADDLHDKETVFMLRDLAAATGAQRGNIMVEATERSVTDYSLAGDVINQLRAEGFPVAIDDFGTGYSSLSYLERIKLDFLKIDKSFVETINTTAPTSEVTLHIIQMAKALRLKIIAEGVETEEQAEFLRVRGVQYAQGWLFGAPMSFENLLARIQGQFQGKDSV